MYINFLFAKDPKIIGFETYQLILQTDIDSAGVKKVFEIHFLEVQGCEIFSKSQNQELNFQV